MKCLITFQTLTNISTTILQHKYIYVYVYLFHIISAIPVPARTIFLNILSSETEIMTHKPIWLLVPFVTYAL